MTPHIFPRQCTVVVADDRRGWTQIFGGKASEPETSRPVEENNFTYPRPPAFGASIKSDPIGILRCLWLQKIKKLEPLGYRMALFI